MNNSCYLQIFFFYFIQENNGKQNASKIPFSPLWINIYIYKTAVCSCRRIDMVWKLVLRDVMLDDSSLIWRANVRTIMSDKNATFQTFFGEKIWFSFWVKKGQWIYPPEKSTESAKIAMNDFIFWKKCPLFKHNYIISFLFYIKYYH